MGRRRGETGPPELPDAAFAAFIRAALPVSPVPSVPEIRLHQAGPRSGLRGWAERSGARQPPYWGRPWGGGLVLARLLLDEPAWVAGRTVLDLGTGSGLVAIAGAFAGASHVRAADIDPQAVAAARLNAALNGVAVEAETRDLLREPPPARDVVLVGDLFYAPALARRAAAFLGRCARAGRLVLVGDPGRAHLPVARLEPIRARPPPDYGTGRESLGTVYRFVPTAVRRGGSSP